MDHPASTLAPKDKSLAESIKTGLSSSGSVTRWGFQLPADAG
jgi:hypothetical protein